MAVAQLVERRRNGRGDDLDEHEEEACLRAQALERHEDHDVAQAQLNAGYGDGQGDEQFEVAAYERGGGEHAVERGATSGRGWCCGRRASPVIGCVS